MSLPIPPALSNPYIYGELIEKIVAHHAHKRPEAIALQQGNRTLSYQQLTAESDKIAAALAHLGLKPHGRVAVRMPRSRDLVVMLLGVLRAGAAYAATDESWPTGRVLDVLAGTETDLLISTKRGELESAASASGMAVVTFDELQKISSVPPAALTDGSCAASIFYTSGSTGKPKGVLSPHRGTIRTVVDSPTLDLDSRSVFLQAAPLPWDALSLELWAPLLNGGRCVLMDQSSAALDSDQLERAIARGVNSLWRTSSLFSLFAEERPELFAGLKLLIVGGERVSVASVSGVMAQYPELKIVNGYGPAEATIFVSTHVIRAVDVADSSTEIPIGTPLPHTPILFLDAEGHPRDADEGELAVGGDGLALGYAGQPEETERAFFSHRGIPYYRTGDRVARDPHGILSYRGRIDDQIKIRGIRIDVGEIEAVLESHPEIVKVCALTISRENQRPVLAVAYSSSAGSQHTESELRKFASHRLLPAMLPTVFHQLTSLPLNANGKTDRKKVRTLLEAHDAKPRTAASPSEPLDESDPLLAEIREIVGLPNLSAEHNLVLAGANSLDIIRLAARVGKHFNTPLSAGDVYRLGSLRQLRAHCHTVSAQQRPALSIPLIADDSEQNIAPLSHAQQRFWLAEMQEPGSADNMLVLAYLLEGPLEVTTLVDSLRKVIDRHPGLRTRYPFGEESAVQEVQTSEEAKLEIQLSALPAGAGHLSVEDAAAQISQDLWDRPFDLEDEAPLRFRICQLSAQKHLLFLQAHHIAFDGWCEQIFLDDLQEVFTGEQPIQQALAASNNFTMANYGEWEAGQKETLASYDLPHWQHALKNAVAPFCPLRQLALRPAEKRPLLRLVRNSRQS